MAKSSYLKYNDEADRAYGVAGMTITMVLLDGEDYLASVNLDNPIGEAVEFTPAFGFAGNPRLTATLAWRELIKQFELSSAMIMGNAVCRYYVGHSMPLPSTLADELRSFLRDEGNDLYQLESDEVDMMYTRTQRYLDRAFSHSAVSAVAHNFASALIERRSLSPGEVFDLLRELQ